MKTWIALIAALFCVEAGAINIRIALSQNTDGTFDTVYPNGTKAIGGSACSTLTCDDIGDAVADINEDSTTQFTISTSGTTDSNRDIGLAYTNIAAANDIQVKALIPAVASWTGDVENFSQFGIGISQSIAQDGYFAHCMIPAIEGGRFKRGSTATSIATSIANPANAAPQYLLLTYDVSASDIECSTSSDDITYIKIGPTVDKTLDCSSNCQAYVFGTSHNANTVTATITNIDIGTTIDTSGSPPDPPTPRQGIVYYADFETGGVQNRTNGLHDGAWFSTMSGTVDGTCNTFYSGSGGAGELGGVDHSRVMNQADAGIAPVEGSNFFRFLLNKNCDYNAFNNGPAGDINGPKDKARTEFHTSALKVGKSAESLPWDAYVWIGWAFYFPSATWEEETGDSQRMVLFEVSTGMTSALNMRSEESFGLTLATQFTTTSVSHSSPEAGSIRWTGNITNYFDQWTPIVCRVRLNPFTGAGPHSTSGISGSTGESYVGDRGSVECWIDEVKVLDRQAPLGPVPGAEGWWTIHEIYKGGWKKRATTVTGPVFYYHDGPWIGIEADGAGYESVHPTQTACTDTCP